MFTVFARHASNSIFFRPVGKVGDGVFVDAEQELPEGAEIWGYTYDELRAMGEGEIQIAERPKE